MSGMQRVHPEGQRDEDPDAYWACVAHSEGQTCCADAPDVYRVTTAAKERAE